MRFWLDYVKFFGPRQVLRLKDADHKVALLDEETKIGDRAAVGVQVTGPHCTQKLYFDKETHLLLKGVVPDDINRKTTEYLESHSSYEPTEIMEEDWFVEGVGKNPQAAGAVRSLLGANFKLPVIVSNHRVRLRVLAQAPFVMCMVTDPGADIPVLRESGPTSESGRGLNVVECCSVRWGWHLLDDGGKVVWALLRPSF